MKTQNSQVVKRQVSQWRIWNEYTDRSGDQTPGLTVEDLE